MIHLTKPKKRTTPNTSCTNLNNIRMYNDEFSVLNQQVQTKQISLRMFLNIPCHYFQYCPFFHFFSSVDFTLDANSALMGNTLLHQKKKMQNELIFL